MPCSRSARRPSVSSEKSIGPEERLMRLFFTEASWSSYNAFESCSSRPISVDLPSSTLPAVVNRRSSISRLCSRNSPSLSRGLSCVVEITRNTLPVSSAPSNLLHRDRSRGFRAPNAGTRSFPQQFSPQSPLPNGLLPCTERIRVNASGTSALGPFRRAKVPLRCGSRQSSRFARPLRVLSRNREEQLEYFPPGYRARCPAPSNSTTERRECFLLCLSGN